MFFVLQSWSNTFCKSAQSALPQWKNQRSVLKVHNMWILVFQVPTKKCWVHFQRSCWPQTDSQHRTICGAKFQVDFVYVLHIHMHIIYIYVYIYIYVRLNNVCSQLCWHVQPSDIVDKDPHWSCWQSYLHKQGILQVRNPTQKTSYKINRMSIVQINTAWRNCHSNYTGDIYPPWSSIDDMYGFGNVRETLF